MDVKAYCDNVQIELIGWKAKLYDIIRKTETLSTGEKEKTVPMIRDLNIMLDELTQRVDQLEKECPTEWDPKRQEIQGQMSQLRDRWQEAWGSIPPGDIGG